MLVVSGPHEAVRHHRAGHPERPSRVEAAMAGLEDLHLDADLVHIGGRAADTAELARVHDASYLEQLEAFCSAGGGDLDPDTYAVVDSWSAAREAAGAGLAVIEELEARNDGVGFSVARPPGHHALPDRAMGFCLLNNVAVAAATLTARGERVLIIDWDVHHGNGTQEIFWNDPKVLYVSTHQWPLYPGTGRATEIGGPHALGYTVNVPLPPGSSGDSVHRAIDEVAVPSIEMFGPTWVLVSAGYDAHRADRMADLALSSGDFARLAELVASFAPRPGRLAFFLEGGYDLEALRASVAASLGAVVGATVHIEEATTADKHGREAVKLAAQERAESLRAARSRAESDRILG